MRDAYGTNEEALLVKGVIEQAAAKLRQAGAIVEEIEVSDLSTILGSTKITDDKGHTGSFSSLSGFEFKKSLTDYLNTANSQYKSYDDLATSGKMISSFKGYDRDPSAESFIKDYALNTLTRSPFVRSRLNAALDNSALDGTSKGVGYDALAYPSITGFVGNLGGSPTTGSNNRMSPFSGFPALSVPAGTVNYAKRSEYPLNVNIEFMAREFDEPTLFNVTIAFEKANPARLTPSHTPALTAAVIQ